MKCCMCERPIFIGTSPVVLDTTGKYCVSCWYLKISFQKSEVMSDGIDKQRSTVRG